MARNAPTERQNVRSLKSRAGVPRLRATRLAGSLALLAGLAVVLAAPSAGASQFRAQPPWSLPLALARVLGPAWQSTLRQPGFPLPAEHGLPAIDPAMAPGSKWRAERVPYPTVPADGGLEAVSCTSAATCMAVGAGTQARTGSRWGRLQSLLSPAGAIASRLSGVSCAAADACIAVGYYTLASTDLPLAELWNGTSWHILATPNPAGSGGSALSAVSCTAPTACTAVGGYQGGTLAERWDGTSWSIQATPSPAGATESHLSAVSCTAADACTAVGDWFGPGTSPAVKATLAEHWNGTSWNIQATPNPAGKTYSELSGVSCAAADACTAVGDWLDDSDPSPGPPVTLAEHWDGTSWNIQATPSPAGAYGSRLSGVSCTAADACTAVGNWLDTAASPAFEAALAEYWNGTSWSMQPFPNPGRIFNPLSAVSCTSARACTAIGLYTSSVAESFTLAAAWNGTRWNIQPTPNPVRPIGVDFRAVSCRSALACTVVGEYVDGADDFVPLAEVRDGTRWRIQATPRPPGATASFLNGVSCTSPRVCMAVGASAGRAGRDRMLAETRNGTRWRIQAVPSPAGATGSGLSSVSCTSASACTATGYYLSNGRSKTLAEAWNGTRWRIQATPNPHIGTRPSASVLTAVSCTSRRACTAVGYTCCSRNGSVTLALAWDGTRWRIQATPALSGGEVTPSAVSCSARRHCTLVGSYGSNTLAEGWDGTRWHVQATPNPSFGSFLTGVSCTSRRACTAVGGYQVDHYDPAFAIAQTWNGSRWSSQTILDGASLAGVSCYAAGACTAIWGGGVLAEGPSDEPHP